MADPERQMIEFRAKDIMEQNFQAGRTLTVRLAVREPDMAMEKLLPQHAPSTENTVYGFQHKANLSQKLT